MSNAKELFTLGMLAIMFNVIMFYGVSDYVGSGQAELSCSTSLPSNSSALNVTATEFGSTSIESCVSEQLGLMNTIIAGVDLLIFGVILYIVLPLPFVK